MSEDTPSVPTPPAPHQPKPRVWRDSKGKLHVSPTKTVKESLEKSLSQTSWATADEITTPEELKKFNTNVVKRLMEIRELFADAPEGLDPTKDPSFLAVIRSEISTKNALFILTGAVHAGPAEERTDEPVPLPEGVDPGFANSPAARAAIEQGLDLTGASDDELDAH